MKPGDMVIINDDKVVYLSMYSTYEYNGEFVGHLEEGQTAIVLQTSRKATMLLTSGGILGWAQTRYLRNISHEST